jgi:hypothetical protein
VVYTELEIRKVGAGFGVRRAALRLHQSPHNETRLSRIIPRARARAHS